MTERDVKDFSVVYVNAEGKANFDHQLRTLVESVNQRRGFSWLFIGVSDADYWKSGECNETCLES